jgi:hypothetical protein
LGFRTIFFSGFFGKTEHESCSWNFWKGFLFGFSRVDFALSFQADEAELAEGVVGLMGLRQPKWRVLMTQTSTCSI